MCYGIAKLNSPIVARADHAIVPDENRSNRDASGRETFLRFRNGQFQELPIRHGQLIDLPVRADCAGGLLKAG